MIGLGVGFQRFRWLSSGMAANDPSIEQPPTILSPPSLVGAAHVGETVVVTSMTTVPDTSTLEQRWLRDVEPIFGEQGLSYTLSPSDDLAEIVPQQRARQSNGPWTSWVNAGSIAVTYVAPSLVSDLSNAVFSHDTGNQTFDASLSFASTLGGNWSVTGANAQISSSGLVTIPTNALVTAVPVTVRYTNSGGTVSSTMNVTVTAIEASITATVQPSIPLLYSGQSFEDMPQFAQMIAPANFTSSAGAIQSVSVAVYMDDEEIDPASVFETDDYVSFIVTVTDEQSNVETFHSGDYVVEFRANAYHDNTDNTFKIVFNENVPDSETFRLIVTNFGAMNGSYDVLKADTMTGIPFVLADSIKCEYDGPMSELAAGDDIILHAGLWFAPESRSLAFTKQAQVNGIDVGLPGDTYTLTADDLGGSFRIEVTVTDGVNPMVVETGQPIALPLANHGPLEVERIASSVANVGNPSSTTVDLGMLAVDETVRMFVGIGLPDTTEGRSAVLLSVAIDGVTTPIIHKSQAGVSCFELAYVEFPRGANPIPEIEVTLSGSSGVLVNSLWAQAFTFSGAATGLDHDIFDSDGVNPTTSVSVNTVPDGAVLVAFADNSPAGADISFTGFGNDIKQAGASSYGMTTGWALTTAAEQRDITLSTGASPSTSILAISFQKA